MKSTRLSNTQALEPRSRPNLSFLFQPRAWIMGVVNATPDSFYAPSRLSQWERVIQEGADLLDIGGESTRPGALPVSAEEEARRLLPILNAIKEKHFSYPVSIDTQKADVARQALEQGADLINDISALRYDPAMADVLASGDVPVVLMHMQGTPPTMQKDPRYQDVVAEIISFFQERMDFAVKKGIAERRIILDPGMGFGKTLEHNMDILKRFSTFKKLGRPLLVGASRKTFIGKLLGHPEILPPEERLEGTLAAHLWAVQEGASGLRVHDVAAARKSLKVWEALLR